jgi:branched-chain amino acid transport system substrate-binding protein
MPRRVAVAAALSAVLALVAAGCGGAGDPIRIGVTTDCQGPLRSFQEGMLAGAEVPFIQRGARLRGPSTTDGVTSIDVAGRRVELVQGCQETGEHTVFVEEARRLVEQEHVDAVVGGATVVTRDLARKYPAVPFVVTFWDDPDTTLRRPVPNLYRFELDASQRVAGLGAYAYRRLGWRRATVLSGDSPGGWAAAAGFTAEFCALGGRIVHTVYRDPFDPNQDVGAAVAAGRPDGVAQLIGPLDGQSAATGQVLAHLRGTPSRRLLLSSVAIEDPAFMRAYGRRLSGVVSTSFIPAGAPDHSLASYRAAFARAFPALPPGFSDSSVVLGYHDAVEALLQAIEQAHGDLGANGEGLAHALASLRVQLPRGIVTLDRDRQAVTAVPLVRLGGKQGAITPVATANGVEQTYGGLLSEAPPPGPGTQRCVKTSPPSWAR